MVVDKSSLPQFTKEEFTGADCSGSTGKSNRVLTTATTSSALGEVQVFMEGRLQIETTDYTISGNDITFSKVVYNSHRIRIYYIS